MDYGIGIGLVAFRGVARIDANELLWQGPDRIHVFPPSQDSVSKDIGRSIQPSIYPVSPQVLQNQTAFSQSWLHYHDSAIYLGCPVPGGTSNSVIYKYDLLYRGWTRWTGMAITSARSMPPQSNGADYSLILYGINGQSYLVGGTADLAFPTSAPTAISCVCQFHALRPGFFLRYKRRATYYRGARLEWVEIEAVLNGTIYLNATAYRSNPSGPVAVTGMGTNQQYILNGGGRGFRMLMPNGGVAGEWITVTLSRASTGVAYIRGCRGYVTQTDEEIA